MDTDAGMFAYGIMILLNLLFLTCGMLGACGIVCFILQRWYKKQREDKREYTN